jgi:hypothetical protein
MKVLGVWRVRSGWWPVGKHVWRTVAMGPVKGRRCVPGRAGVRGHRILRRDPRAWRWYDRWLAPRGWGKGVVVVVVRYNVISAIRRGWCVGMVAPGNVEVWLHGMRVEDRLPADIVPRQWRWVLNVVVAGWSLGRVRMRRRRSRSPLVRRGHGHSRIRHRTRRGIQSRLYSRLHLVDNPRWRYRPMVARDRSRG